MYMCMYRVIIVYHIAAWPYSWRVFMCMRIVTPGMYVTLGMDVMTMRMSRVSLVCSKAQSNARASCVCMCMCNTTQSIDE